MSNGLLYSADYNWMTHEVRLLDKSGNALLRFFPDVGTDDITKPLTFISKEDYSHIALRANGTVTNEYEYMTAWGSGEWEPYTLGTNITLMQGNAASFRISARNMAQDSSNYVYFTVDGKIEAWNNVQSLVDVGDYTLTMPDYGLYRLFMRQGGITKSPLMPATTVGAYAYSNAFYECLLLTRAPEVLPATVLDVSCYRAMFYGCSILTNAPSILATILPQYACSGMFSACRAISEVSITSTDISATNCLHQWLSVVSSTGNFYCDPNTEFPSGISGIPTGWDRWVYGAEDTGATTIMYHNGVAEPVRIGTSSYGTCYSIQGWAGFRTLDQMHSAGYTFGVQTQITIYSEYGESGTEYKCEANAEDGFTETMYAYGNGGYKSYTEQKTAGHYLPQDIPLTISHVSSYYSTVKLSKSGTINNTYEYRKLPQTEWSSYTLGDSVRLNSGEIVQFRCSDHSQTVQSSTKYVRFIITGIDNTVRDKVYGNINSMIDGTNFATMTSLVGYDWAFCNFFKSCTSIQDASDLKLPATTLSESCYRSFFDSCINLSEPPELPATTLATYCYRSFFYNSGVTHSPALPATTMATGAYYRMFMNCASLLDCPELPATTLADEAYYQMFYNCDAITKAPLLPATTLTATCYKWIYANSALLAEVHIAATDATATDCLMEWLSNCAASGCVFAYPDLPLPEDSTSGVPEGWHRFILDAEDTGTTTTMYYHGAQVMVRVGTYAGTACYSVPGWKGFKDLSGMHKSGYSLYPQTQVTMYYYDERTVTLYECAANNEDGFTSDMYCIDASGAPLKPLSDQNIDGYYLAPTPWTGLKITSGTWTGDYTINTSLYKVGTLNNTFQIDDGSGWRYYTLGTVVELQKNSSLKFRRGSGTTQQSEDNYVRFSFVPNTSTFTESSGKITVSGNPYSLLTKTGFDSLTTLADYPYALYKLFWQQNAIGSASGLVLPAMTLSTHCYHDLLSTCAYLLDAPELPATTLATYCYEGLYYGCTRLSSSYHLLLPATTLVVGCYEILFWGAQLINEVRIAATNTTIPTDALDGWLGGTAASGTVYAPTSLKLPRDSVNGVPSGWTRRNINNYPN